MTYLGIPSFLFNLRCKLLPKFPWSIKRSWFNKIPKCASSGGSMGGGGALGVIFQNKKSSTSIKINAKISIFDNQNTLEYCLIWRHYPIKCQNPSYIFSNPPPLKFWIRHWPYYKLMVLVMATADPSGPKTLRCAVPAFSSRSNEGS